MEFEAKVSMLIDDGYCTVLSFASDAIDPKQSVILSVTNQPTSQDVELGQSGVHFELGGSQLSGYNVVKAIDAQSNQLILKLDAGAASESGADSFLRIILNEPTIDGRPLAVVVDQFRSRLPSESSQLMK
jgi:hypothetical protein